MGGTPEADGLRAPSRVYGAGRDLEGLVATHLFVICPNNSGSTFLQRALATCRATWNLPREGRAALGYAGPVPGSAPSLPPGKLWASRRRWRAVLTDAGAYDWPRTRKAWYFQASARDARASVFVTKSPPHLLVVDALARHFVNPKFLFMVRNPYAVCEGICRSTRNRLPALGADLPALAARHVAACFEYQRRNIEAQRSRGTFFSYEAMCGQPGQVARQIRGLVPELDDLNLGQRLPVKGRYDEMLTDMNARQIARLDPPQVETLNRVFGAHRELLEDFGYELMEPGR